jgi:riboflavin kinase/FMN adenylyltransferase
MRTIEISERNRLPHSCVLTIGNFDGVHLGHQAILKAARKAAARKKTELAAMTFDPHPVAILQPEKNPGVLTPLKLKASLLKERGVECLILLKSGEELLGLSAQQFVERFLVKEIRPAAVIEGEDFNFGRDRSGNIDKLQQLGTESGFEVCVVPAETVRLSTGETVKGHGKGKQLGFPTANLGPSHQIIPAEGVYAGFIATADTAEGLCRSKQQIPAALSIGRAATLGRRGQLVEAHLLVETVGDLIGKWLAMDFVKRLRGQMKFETEKQLSAQIAEDCDEAKRILADTHQLGR